MKPTTGYHANPSTLNPHPSSLIPQTQTLNPIPSTLNPQPSTLSSEALPDAIKYGTAGGILLLFYKFTNSIFPPAVIVPVLISQNGGLLAGMVWCVAASHCCCCCCCCCCSSSSSSSSSSSTSWSLPGPHRTLDGKLPALESPEESNVYAWALGHAAMYSAALYTSDVRSKLRSRLMRGQMAGLSADLSGTLPLSLAPSALRSKPYTLRALHPKPSTLHPNAKPESRIPARQTRHARSPGARLLQRQRLTEPSTLNPQPST